MEHIITENVKKLVKEDLIDTVKNLVVFSLFLIVGFLTAAIVISINFSIVAFFAHSFMLFIGSFIAVSFFSGVDEAHDLPKYVGNGITRKEYSISVILRLAIFNLIGLIIMFSHNILFSHVDILEMLIFSTLIWMGYFIGYTIVIIIVRSHWIIGMFWIFAAVNAATSLVRVLFNFRNLEAIQLSLTGSPMLLIRILFFTIILGTVAYFLTKSMPIKVK